LPEKADITSSTDTNSIRELLPFGFQRESKALRTPYGKTLIETKREPAYKSVAVGDNEQSSCRQIRGACV
jgi:hypothetical protein